MSAARSYAAPNVDDRYAHSPLDPPTVARPPVASPPGGPEPAEAGPPADDGIDLSGLSIAGITRRRVGWAAGAVIACWIVLVFARQVSEASAAAGRADDLRAENAALAAEVAALADELELIVRPEYVAQQARGIRLGNPGEIPFSLDRAVPLPGEGAPGSASVALGAQAERRTPLESWLSLLFGPTD